MKKLRKKSELAEEVGVPYVENHLFLDDVHTVKHITKQCHLIKEFLMKQPFCIAIGHVGTQGKKQQLF
ncbi:divergent polysaccharide deacetylase family protein [Ammoniphilus resinae]|uniref:divergent polysaccharide deacetylase family protein n=1 Tax=Ammoniphilus resinae TaxID=861532 RepID=UPI001AE547F2